MKKLTNGKKAIREPDIDAEVQQKETLKEAIIQAADDIQDYSVETHADDEDEWIKESEDEYDTEGTKELDPELEQVLIDALSDIDEKEKELMMQKQTVISADYTMPVTEEQWKNICQTPLRKSDHFLIRLICNTFCDASDIRIVSHGRHDTDVTFYLSKYLVTIPADRKSPVRLFIPDYVALENQANVDLSERFHDHTNAVMYRYFEMVDAKEKWKNIVREIVPEEERETRKQLKTRISRLKLAKQHRDYWERCFAAEEEIYQDKKDKQQKAWNKLHDMRKELEQDILPELHKFTDAVYCGNFPADKEMTVEEAMNNF